LTKNALLLKTTRSDACVSQERQDLETGEGRLNFRLRNENFLRLMDGEPISAPTTLATPLLEFVAPDQLSSSFILMGDNR